MDNNKIDDNEISLLDLFAVLLKYKKSIISITFIAAIFIVVLAVISLKLPPEKSFMPNVYQPKALMLINDTNSQGGSLSDKLAASGLGSIASFAGISAGGSGPSYSRLAIFLSTTNSFLDSVVHEFNLVERYKIEKSVKTQSRKALSNRLKTSFDEKTGVFSITFEDIDPQFAKNVVLFCVDYYEKKFTSLGLDKDKIEKENLENTITRVQNKIEELIKKREELERSTLRTYTSDSTPLTKALEKLTFELSIQKSLYGQLNTQYELLKIKLASNRPILQILEYPEVPDQKSGPSRGKLCIIVTFAAFFFSIFLAFLRNAVSNIKKDPHAMSKLKGN